MTFDFGLAEYTHLHTGLFKNFFQIIHNNLSTVTFNHDRTRGRRAEETYFQNGQTGQCTCVEGKLAKIL